MIDDNLSFIERRRKILYNVEKLNSVSNSDNILKHKLQNLNEVLNSDDRFNDEQKVELQKAIMINPDIDILLLLNHTYSFMLMRQIRLCLQRNIDIVNLLGRRTFTDADITALRYLYKTNAPDK